MNENDGSKSGGILWERGEICIAVATYKVYKLVVYKSWKEPPGISEYVDNRHFLERADLPNLLIAPILHNLPYLHTCSKKPPSHRSTIVISLKTTRFFLFTKSSI